MILGKINKEFLAQCPIPKFKGVFERFDYENKGIYSALSLVKSIKLDKQQ